MIREFTILTLALALVMGMGSMAAAIDNGVYDFYGTYILDGYYADGAGQACALADANLPCPSTAGFCIRNLQASSNVLTSNEAAPYYGIAIGKIVGLFTFDYDGAGPVTMTVDDSDDADTLMNMAVGTMSGGCGGELDCVESISLVREYRRS